MHWLPGGYLHGYIINLNKAKFVFYFQKNVNLKLVRVWWGKKSNDFLDFYGAKKLKFFEHFNLYKENGEENKQERKW